MNEQPIIIDQIIYVPAADLNVDALDDIVAAIKKARKSLIASEESHRKVKERRAEEYASNKAALEEARANNQRALDACDLDAITKHTGEMKRLMKKLEVAVGDTIAEAEVGEEPKKEAYESAVKRLVGFVQFNVDGVTDADNVFAGHPETEEEEAA